MNKTLRRLMRVTKKAPLGGVLIVSKRDYYNAARGMVGGHWCKRNGVQVFAINGVYLKRAL